MIPEKTLYLNKLVSSPSLNDDYIEKSISTTIGYSGGYNPYNNYNSYSSIRTSIYGTASNINNQVIEDKTPLTLDFLYTLIRKK